MKNPYRAALWLAAASIVASAPAGCRRPSQPQGVPGAGHQADGAPAADVVATVNAAPITNGEVAAQLNVGAHGPVTADRAAAVLESLIGEELAAQEAARRNLPIDDRAREEIARSEARLRAVRRSALAGALYRDEVRAKAQVTDEELQKYFDENQARIQTEIHVKQILMRSEDDIGKALARLRAGAAFDEVAGRGLPREAIGEKPPWDLGFLKWSQIPEPWWPSLDRLKPGEISDVIRGPNSRFWIIQLVEKRENPSVTLDSIKAPLREILKSRKTAELQQALIQKLRAQARIVRVKPPTVARPAPAPDDEE